MDVVVSWSVLPATATKAGIRGIDGSESGTEDPNPGWPGRVGPYEIQWTRPPTAYSCSSATTRSFLQTGSISRKTGCAGQLVAKAKRRAAAEEEKQRAGRGPYYNAHACFLQEKWPTVHTAAQWRECWISATERFQRKPHKFFDLRCPLST